MPTRPEKFKRLMGQDIRVTLELYENVQNHLDADRADSVKERFINDVLDALESLN